MKTLVLVNPVACRGARVSSLWQALDYLRSLGVRFDLNEAESPAQLTGAVRQAATQNYDLVIAAGGDGTAHAALQALVGTETALGILPFGNGNDFARNLGLPLDPFLACRLLAARPLRQIDLAHVSGPIDAYYAGVGGFGFDAAVNRKANEWRLAAGPMLYVAAAVPVLLRFRPIVVEMRSDGGNFAGEVMFVAVTNGGGYGGGLRITPEARMDDGWLDVAIVERTSKLDLLEAVPQLWRGTFVRKPFLRSWRARRVELLAPAGADYFCDGEFLTRLPLRIEVRPQALRVVAPLEPL